MLKLHQSDFIRQKQFQSAGFKESDFPSVEKFLEHTSSLPLTGFERQQAVVLLSRKIEGCKKQLIAKCDNSSLDDARWDDYRRAHGRLTGYLNLLNKHN